MDFGPFVLLSLFYALIGVRVVAQLIKNWRATFDRQFTEADHSLVDQSAFFVLVPISVALHELGHAIAIWSFGGDVVGWGYYAFAGFVSYLPAQFSAAERIVIAAAGTIVNLLLAAGAVGLVFGRRPPMRAAFNELLLQFTLLSLLNALVVYPVLDLFSNLNGDWSQMYRGGVPALSVIIGVVHVGVLGAIAWGWRSPGPRQRLARLTETTGGTRRLRLDGHRRGSDAPDGESDPVEAALKDAAGRVASGWSTPVEGATQRRPNGFLLALSWRDNGTIRSVFVLAPDEGDLALTGAAHTGDGPPTGFSLGRQPRTSDADQLTLALRLAMERVAARTPGSAGAESNR